MYKFQKELLYYNCKQVTYTLIIVKLITSIKLQNIFNYNTLKVEFIFFGKFPLHASILEALRFTSVNKAPEIECLHM